MDDAFKLLTTGSKSALPRQQTLRALIDWSYQLLSEAQRIAFARLGVFVGGCGLEAAEAIIGAEGIEQSAVLDLVTELVDKSLLVVEESADITRFRMLDTIRHFAMEKLDESTRRRHLDYFIEAAEQAMQEFTGPRQAEYLRRMDAEHDNLLAAPGFRRHIRFGFAAGGGGGAVLDDARERLRWICPPRTIDCGGAGG